MANIYSFHTITGGTIFKDGENTLFIPNNTDMEKHLSSKGYTGKDLKNIMEIWAEVEAFNPLQDFILSLINEEWANGSDRVGRALQDLINTDALKQLNINTPHATAEKVHSIYFEEMEQIPNLLDDLSTHDLSGETAQYLSNLVVDIQKGGMDIGQISFSLARLLWNLEVKAGV